MTGSDIDGILHAATSAGRVPGVVALAANREGIVYQGAFGKRALNGDAPMTLDSLFWIHSMTKAVTGVAAMQCVERGLLDLDRPSGDVLPELAEPRVLDGFDVDGRPRLRPANQPITLRRLLTHTAGFVYDIWNANLSRCQQTTGFPSVRSGKLEALNSPLAFDPGDRWEYGINIEWAGRMVEAATGQELDACFREHIFAPLGMTDIGYTPSGAQAGRFAQSHARNAAGELTPVATPIPQQREYFPGGSGLFASGPAYLTFLRMLLNGGSLNGAQILRPETLALMAQNHIGELNVRPLPSQDLSLSHDMDIFPGMVKKWGLTWLINTKDVPGGRRAGSLAWAGLRNCFFWLDPKSGITGVLMTQVLPFTDPTVMQLLDEFERAVYRTMGENTRHG